MKKGEVTLQLILILIILFVLGIVVFMAYQAFDDVYTPLYNDLSSVAAKETLDETHDRFPSVFDSLFVLVFILLWSAGIISTITKDDHPVLFVFMMIVLVFVTFAGVLLGNSFEEIYQDDEFSSLTSTFPKIFWIMSHLLPIGIVIGFSILLVYLAKNKG